MRPSALCLVLLALAAGPALGDDIDEETENLGSTIDTLRQIEDPREAAQELGQLLSDQQELLKEIQRRQAELAQPSTGQETAAEQNRRTEELNRLQAQRQRVLALQEQTTAALHEKKDLIPAADLEQELRSGSSHSGLGGGGHGEGHSGAGMPEISHENGERLESAWARDPQDTTLGNGVTAYRFQNGDVEGGLDTAQRVLALDPDDPMANTYASMGYYSIGDGALARSHAQRALARDPGIQAARDIMHLTERGANPRADVDQLKRFGFGLSGEDAMQAAARREGALAGGAVRGLKEDVDRRGRAVEGGPSGASTRLTRQGRSQLMKGDPYKARKSIEAALQEDPDNAEAWALYATLLNAIGEYDKALEAANKALELNPDDAAAYGARAMSRYKTGRFDGAIDDSSLLLRMMPGYAKGYMTRALALERLQRLREMFKDLEAAARLDPAYADTLDKAKRKYADPDNPDAAIDLEPDDFSPFMMAVGRRMPDLRLLLLLAFGALITLAGLGAKLRGGGAPDEEPESQVETAALSAPQAAIATSVAPAAVAAPAAAPRVGNYQVGREIGRGGMGVVYEAFDPSLERKVALKRMREEVALNARDKEAFLKEAKLVASLQHPAIIAIHDIFEREGQLYLVFEHVDGETLDGTLERRGRLEPAEAVKILSTAGEAVQFAHDHGVLHRDLKPSNIMLDRQGFTKVMDFGIARAAKNTVSRLTKTQIIGTPAYMAPEQETGHVAAASDVFALGATAYHLLTGELPFDGPDAYTQKTQGRVRPPRELAPALPQGLQDAILRALHPDPAARTRTPAGFVSEVLAA